MKSLMIFCFAVCNCIYIGTVSAQGVGTQAAGINLEVSPRIIQPLSPVQLELVSYSSDINRARTSLYVDGVLISQVLGQRIFTVDSPAIGQTRDVQIVIETRNNGTVTKNISLTPAQVDLVSEALDSYTPTLYAGKKLAGHNGSVSVAAIPYFVDASGRKIDPNSLVYTWYVSDKKQVNASGYGKQQFIFTGSPLYRTQTITVETETVDGSLLAKRTIELPAYDPVIRFYRDNPLWGLDLSQAITADESLVLDVPELEVRSVPYFFSDIQSNYALDYQWRMNGSEMQTFGDNNLINLRAPENQSGQARISLKISNNNEILQIAESVFNVIFGDSSAETRGQGGSGTSENNSSGFNFFGTGN